MLGGDCVLYISTVIVFSDIYIYSHSVLIMQVNTAFFRGTATGGGVTEDTNQRLKVLLLSATMIRRSPPMCAFSTLTG